MAGEPGDGAHPEVTPSRTRQDKDTQKLRLAQTPPAVTRGVLCQPCSAWQGDTHHARAFPKFSLSSEAVMAWPGIALPLKSMMIAGPRDPRDEVAEALTAQCLGTALPASSWPIAGGHRGHPAWKGCLGSA